MQSLYVSNVHDYAMNIPTLLSCHVIRDQIRVGAKVVPRGAVVQQREDVEEPKERAANQTHQKEAIRYNIINNYYHKS